MKKRRREGTRKGENEGKDSIHLGRQVMHVIHWHLLEIDQGKRRVKGQNYEENVKEKVHVWRTRERKERRKEKNERRKEKNERKESRIASIWAGMQYVSSTPPGDESGKEARHMKSFIAKRVNSILVNLRYLRFKLLKYKENNKKICNTFYHNFKNIPLYIMRKVSLEGIILFHTMVPLLLKFQIWRLTPFAIKLFTCSEQIRCLESYVTSAWVTGISLATPWQRALGSKQIHSLRPNTPARGRELHAARISSSNSRAWTTTLTTGQVSACDVLASMAYCGKSSGETEGKKEGRQNWKW